MIKVNLPSRTLGLAFRHSEVEIAIPQKESEKKLDKPVQFRKTRATFCEIYEITPLSSKWVCEGSAYLGVGDQFRKSMGRKFALTKALKLLSPPKYGEKRSVSPLTLGKKERELVWQAYHNRGTIEGEKVEEPNV